MVCAGGLVSAIAADNVYSVNVVGYTTVTITNAYVMIANQLNDNAGNYLTNHLPTAPTGTQIFKFDPTAGAYAIATRLATAWSGPGAGMTIAPGEGVFVRKPPAQASITLTFVGEVMQGDLVNPVTPGYDIYSPMVPQQGGLTSVHGYPQTAGDQCLIFNPILGAYTTKTVNNATPPAWIGGEPVINVNQAVWIKNNTANIKQWLRSFTVNP